MTQHRSSSPTLTSSPSSSRSVATCAFDNEMAAAQAIELVDAGITHVLDVRHECDDAELWSYVPEVTYRWDGIDDAGQRIPAAWFEGIVAWALEAIEAGGVVLTHCHMGINRGPSAGYAVLLGMGWDPVEALAAIRAARPIAHIWYAEDALAWHFDRIGASPAERASDARARCARGARRTRSTYAGSSARSGSTRPREAVVSDLSYTFCIISTSQLAQSGRSRHSTLGRSTHEDQRTARRQRRRPRDRGRGHRPAGAGGSRRPWPTPPARRPRCRSSSTAAAR